MSTKTKTETGAGKTSAARIEQLVKAARKYRRTIHKWVCRFSPEDGNYIYYITVARSGSGSRGGRLVARQDYGLVNLYPEQRERLVKGIGCEKGVVV